jgi:hypothetical protein
VSVQVVTVDAARATTEGAVVDAIVVLFDALRPLLREASSRAAVVVVAGEDREDPLVAATIHAVRGAVISIATEVDDTARLNVILAERAEDAEATLTYLAEPEADYTTAFTFDLLGASR